MHSHLRSTAIIFNMPGGEEVVASGSSQESSEDQYCYTQGGSRRYPGSELLGQIAAADLTAPEKAALSALTETLLCSICGNLYEDPWAIVGCSHTFCFECLDDALNTKGKKSRGHNCPTCQIPFYRIDIKVQRDIANSMPAFGRVMATVRDYAAHAAAMEAARVPSPKASQEPAAKDESPAGSKPRLSWADKGRSHSTSPSASPRHSASDQSLSQHSPPLMMLPQQQQKEIKKKPERTLSELLVQELASSPQQLQQQEHQQGLQVNDVEERGVADCEESILNQDGTNDGDGAVSSALDKTWKEMKKYELEKEVEKKEVGQAKVGMDVDDEVEDKSLASRGAITYSDSQAVLCGETQNVLCGETPLPVDEVLSQVAEFPRPAVPVQKANRHLMRDSAAAAHVSSSKALQSQHIPESGLLESTARDVSFDFRAKKVNLDTAPVVAADESKDVLCGDSQAVLCGETQNVLCGETPLSVDDALSQGSTRPRPALSVQQHEQKNLARDSAAAMHESSSEALESQQFSESHLLECQTQDINGALPAKNKKAPEAAITNLKLHHFGEVRAQVNTSGSFATFDADVLFDTQDRFLAVSETQAVTQDPNCVESIGDSSVATTRQGGHAESAANNQENSEKASEKVQKQIAAEGGEEGGDPFSAEEDGDEEETCDPVHRAMAQFMATGVLDDGTCEPHSIAEGGYRDKSDDNYRKDYLAECLTKQGAKESTPIKEEADGAQVATAAAKGKTRRADCSKGNHQSSSLGGGKSAVPTKSRQQTTLDSVPQLQTHEQLGGTFGSYGTATCDDSMTIPNTQQVEAMALAMSNGRNRGGHAAGQASIYREDATVDRQHHDENNDDDADDLSEEEEGHSPPIFSRPSHPVRAPPRPTMTATATAEAARDNDDDGDEVEEDDESQQILLLLPQTRHSHTQPLPRQPPAPQLPQQTHPLNRWRSPQASVQDSLDEPSGLASPPVPWAMAKGQRQPNKGHKGTQQHLGRQMSATSMAPLTASRKSPGSSSGPAESRGSSANKLPSSAMNGFAAAAAAVSETEAAPDEDFDADAAAATFNKSRNRGFKSSSMSGSRGFRDRASVDQCSDGGRPPGRPSVATTADYATSPGNSDGCLETPRATRHGARDSTASSSGMNRDVGLDCLPRSGQVKKRSLEDLSAAACNSSSRSKSTLSDSKKLTTRRKRHDSYSSAFSAESPSTSPVFSPDHAASICKHSGGWVRRSKDDPKSCRKSSKRQERITSLFGSGEGVQKRDT